MGQRFALKGFRDLTRGPALLQQPMPALHNGIANLWRLRDKP